MSKFIEYEVKNKVATLWLNRAEKKNCINWEMLNEMADAINDAAQDDSVLALVVRGRERQFCAGADLDMVDSDILNTITASIKLDRLSAKTYGTRYNMRKPTIVVVEELCGGGRF